MRTSFIIDEVENDFRSENEIKWSNYAIHEIDKYFDPHSAHYKLFWFCAKSRSVNGNIVLLTPHLWLSLIIDNHYSIAFCKRNLRGNDRKPYVLTAKFPKCKKINDQSFRSYLTLCRFIGDFDCSRKVHRNVSLCWTVNIQYFTITVIVKVDLKCFQTCRYFEPFLHFETFNFDGYVNESIQQKWFEAEFSGVVSSQRLTMISIN